MSEEIEGTVARRMTPTTNAAQLGLDGDVSALCLVLLDDDRLVRVSHYPQVEGRDGLQVRQVVFMGGKVPSDVRMAIAANIRRQARKAEEAPAHLRQHGPCAGGTGPLVRDVLPEYLTDEVRAMVLDRLDFGLEKYGVEMRVGWSGAWAALCQEALDAVVYLVAGTHGLAAPLESAQVIASQVESLAALAVACKERDAWVRDQARRWGRRKPSSEPPAEYM
jgi:hypothetical protein